MIMKYTENYKLKMPEGNDYVSVDDFNDNFESVDKELALQRSEFTELSADVGSMVLKESKDVYVSPSGNDETGDGTSSKPWRTIQKAVNECPCSSNGEFQYKIHIADGTYNERVSIYSKQTYISLIGSNSENAVVIKGGLGLLNSLFVKLTKKIVFGSTDTDQAYTILCSNTNIYCDSTSSLKIIGNKNSPAYTRGIRCQEKGCFIIPRGGSNNHTFDNCYYAIEANLKGEVFVGESILNANCGSGLVAADGGTITYHDGGVTNNASTKLYTSNGGRIYTGDQTSIGKY